MTLDIISIGQKLVMLLQNDLWNDISAFLHLLLDPVLIVLQDEGLRRMILSTVIWSLFVICGLVFVVYEFPSIISLLMGTQTKPIKRQSTTTAAPKTQSESSSASRHQISRDKAQHERDRRETAVRKTGVTVTTKIIRINELLRLTVEINNGSNSHINMVVVDLDLPDGIDAETFRMKRLGTINSGEIRTVDFMLRLMGGIPSEIGGHVEFLGASYEASLIPLPVPDMEGLESE